MQLRRNVSALAKKNNRLLARCTSLQRTVERRNAQIRYDQQYADMLEEFVTHADIRACREEMKRRHDG